MAEQRQAAAAPSGGAAPGQIGALQKAALVISALGTENASSVFKYFTDEEIEKLTLEVAKMDYWPAEVIEDRKSVV